MSKDIYIFLRTNEDASIFKLKEKEGGNDYSLELERKIKDKEESFKSLKDFQFSGNCKSLCMIFKNKVTIEEEDESGEILTGKIVQADVVKSQFSPLNTFVVLLSKFTGKKDKDGKEEPNMFIYKREIISTELKTNEESDAFFKKTQKTLTFTLVGSYVKKKNNCETQWPSFYWTQNEKSCFMHDDLQINSMSTSLKVSGVMFKHNNIINFSFSPNLKQICIVTAEKDGKKKQVSILDTKSKNTLLTSSLSECDETKIKWNNISSHALLHIANTSSRKCYYGTSEMSLLSIKPGETPRIQRIDTDVSNFEWNGSGNTFVVLQGNPPSPLVFTADGKKTFVLPKGPRDCLQMTPPLCPTKLLMVYASGNFNGSSQLWDLSKKTPMCISSFEPDYASKYEISPDCKTILVSTVTPTMMEQNKIELYSVFTGKTVYTQKFTTLLEARFMFEEPSNFSGLTFNEKNLKSIEEMSKNEEEKKKKNEEVYVAPGMENDEMTLESPNSNNFVNSELTDTTFHKYNTVTGYSKQSFVSNSQPVIGMTGKKKNKKKKKGKEGGKD